MSDHFKFVLDLTLIVSSRAKKPDCQELILYETF